MTLPPLGAVLAGGAATRIGGAKAMVELDGRPLIAYPLRVLAEAQMEAVVVAKRDSPLPPLDTPVISEPDEPRHALAGVVAALHHAGNRGAIVLPCDAPFISLMLLRVLAGATSTTAVRAGGRTHPLIAFYSYDSLERLDLALNAGDSATQALESLDPSYIEAPERETFNINTAKDLARAEEMLREPQS